MKKKLSLLIVSLCIPFLAMTQETEKETLLSDSLTAHFARQLILYPQEKLYLQIDKPEYISGETLWFRVHLVDALLHLQSNASRYVYVELIDQLETVINRVKIRPDSLGCFHGYLPLDEELADGDYMLRAYTLYMRNQGDDYFFKKNIRIINPLSLNLDNNSHSSFENKKDTERRIFTGKNTRQINKPHPDEDFDVSFLPEGGYLPAGLNSFIAFKAIKTNGLSENISGKIVDEEGNIILPNFKTDHLGMGKFTISAKEGKTYYAECTNDQNITKRFPLPKGIGNYCGLQVNRMKDRIYVAVRKTVDYDVTRPLYLLAHLRGAVLYCNPVDLNQEYLIFENSFFPSGIVQFLLINENKEILSERLVFNYNENDIAQVTFSTDKEGYMPKQQICANVKINDVTGQPLAGNFSVSVTDDKDILPDSSVNIVSHLLLSSELKGYIENPNYYMKQDDRKAAMALDLLMLTHGWRRYDISNVVKGNPEKPEYSPEISQVISGKASIVFSSVKDGYISILALNDSLETTETTDSTSGNQPLVVPHVVQTDQSGRFELKDIEFPEETRFIVQANTKNNRGNWVFVELDKTESYPPVAGLLPTRGLSEHQLSEAAISKANKKYVMEGGIREINLAEVIVTARRKSPPTDSPYYSPLSSSQVITADMIEQWNYMDMRTLLSQIPGLTFNGDQMSVRGGGAPLVVLDHIPYEPGFFSILDLNVSDVSELFLVKDASAGIMFGARAAAGALIVNTKKGSFEYKNKKSGNISDFIKPLGYQKPVEFYSPKYETNEERNQPDLRTTIFWKPNVEVTETGDAFFNFYSSDAETTYSVVIEGTSAYGHLIHKVANIRRE